MSANSFGTLLTLTTFGESHGPAIGGILDGFPPGFPVNESLMQQELERRRPGKSRHTTQRREPDIVKILSGVFEGMSTGAPIAFVIENVDQRSKDYGEIKNTFRPNHADYTYQQKYGLRDYRGGGRSSARETAVRVAAGALAKNYLHGRCGVTIQGYLSQLGPLQPTKILWETIDDNPFFTPDPDLVPALENYMDALRKSGDSIGAKVTVVARGVPVGWGAPLYDKLDAAIAYAMMSINAVRGVEIGDGFAVVTQTGSEHRDAMTPAGFLSNHSGGILGGISTGQDIVVHLALKPTSSIRLPGQSIDIFGNSCEVKTEGRHDPCVGIRATPIAEAMLALVLLDQYLIHRGHNADVQSPTPQIPGQVSAQALPQVPPEV